MSSEKNYNIYLEDILESIEYIESYINEISLKSFLNDPLLQDAVIRRIEIIGEAVGKLPEEIKKNKPEVPWQDMKDMRNKLIHDYGYVDLELVWAVVQKELPTLKEKIAQML